MKVLLALAALAGSPQEDARPYRVPADTDAAVRADNALSFLRQESWPRAIEELQVLIERHGDAVLPVRFAEHEASLYGLHAGAATWALARLAELPESGRARYRERFAEEARLALEAARRDADGLALAAVGRRFPLTSAGVSAWTALGDLELARGDGAAAIAAWERAALRAEQAGLPAPAGLEARREAADRLRADLRVPSGLALPGDAPGAGPAPLAGADRWVIADLDLSPFDRMRGQEGYNLFPLLEDERILVATSLRLYCIDAFSANVLWTAGPPPGWDGLAAWKAADILRRVDHNLALSAPAAGRGVVVAALQVPYADQQSHEYQGIDILGAIPERRLFAFELESGRPLWDHAPPSGWDGETGPYEERMLVAAPPVVAGSRVLVPCYQMRGRIDLHVACYDLADGRLRWSTSLISGQNELNMFGRQKKEFSGAPVVVDGDGVFAVTQLGTLARLDLFTGRIVWEANYEQVPIPKSPGWTDEDRPVYWRNAPPVVVDGVVLATPHDSPLLLACDAETGAVLWSFDYDGLPAGGQGRSAARVSYRALLGAHGDTVYLAGSGPGATCVSALQKPGGLHPGREGASRGPFQARWTSFVEGHPERSPRPVLGAEEIVVFGQDERVTLDRRTGRRVEAKSVGASESDRGNLLLSDGVLVTLGNRRLSAEFDWDLLLERAEAALAADPAGVEPRVAHASLALRRARSFADAGRTGSARPLLDRARASLEEVLVPEGQAARDPRVARTLFGVLRESARVAQLDAAPDEALEALSDALVLASTPEEVRDTLLAQEALYRTRAPDRWRAVLARLEAEVPAQPVPPERLEGDAGWLNGESLWAIAPADLRGYEIPVGLWVLLTRADGAAREHDPVQALEDLHAALARYGDRPLPFGLTVADVAAGRIQRRLELDGREAYAPFERRAEQLFERAVAARDEGLLVEVGRLYPEAEAARRAELVRFEWALESGRPADAAALAFPALGASERLTPEGAATLARLGALFGASGNPALERLLVRRAARTSPEVPSPAHGDRPLGEVARSLPEAEVPAVPPATFGETLARAAEPAEGRYEMRGSLVVGGGAESPPERIDVLTERRRVLALSAADPARPRWSHQLPEAPLDDALALRFGLVVAGAAETVVALDAATGEEAWRADLRPGSEVEAVVLHGGLALVLASRDDDQTGEPRRSLSAFDVAGGVPLWSLPLEGRARWSAPVCEDGRAVLIEPRWSAASAAVAVVVDLALGRIERSLDLGTPVADADGAWIEGGRLVLPFFRSSDAHESRVVAWDLDTGREAFRVGFGKDREIVSVAAWGGRTFLVVLPMTPGGRGGEVLELDSRLGRARRVEALRQGEDTMGLPRRERTELLEPCLFTYALTPKASSVPVRMIPLDDGPGWVYSLHVAEEELYDDGLPRPAVGDRLVGIAYSTRNRANLAREESRLELVDRRGGFHRRSIVLSPQMSKARVGVYGLGDAVLLLGTGRYGTRDVSRMEVLETMR